MKKQRGISLIEILISMVLGLSLMAGIGQLFIQSQKSFSTQRNLSDMTDDGSIALELLGKGFLQAGFAENGNFTGSDGVSFQAEATPFSDTTLSFNTGEYIKGTDSEIIYRYRISMNNSSDPRMNGDPSNFICTDTDVFKNALVGEMLTVHIYLKNDDNGIPFLRCSVKTASIQAPTDEEQQKLISEVYKLIIRYGVRETGGLYYADKANMDLNADNWKKVVALKVFLVMRSADDNLTRNHVIYSIEGVAQPAVPDKRLYKVFSKTVYLRAPDH